MQSDMQMVYFHYQKQPFNKITSFRDNVLRGMDDKMTIVNNWKIITN